MANLVRSILSGIIITVTLYVQPAIGQTQWDSIVTTIVVDSLPNTTATTLAEFLQGRVAGVSVTPTGGLAGDGARLQIRGVTSLLQSNTPLIYLDGIRLDNEEVFSLRLNDISLEAVERIEILKSAAVASHYGAGAANGVIRIFTRVGSISKPRLSIKIDQAPVTSPDVYKPNAGFARSEAQLANMRQVFGDPNLQAFQLVQKNFISDLLDSGERQTYSLALNGGGAGVNYFLNGRYHRLAGPYNPQSQDFLGAAPGGSDDLVRRAQFHGHLSLTPFSKLRIRLLAMYGDIHDEFPLNGNSIYAPLALAMYGKPERVAPNNPQGLAAFATVREATYQQNIEETRHRLAGFSATYNLTRALTLNAMAGIDDIDQRDSQLTPFDWNVDGVTAGAIAGQLSVAEVKHTNSTLDLNGVWNLRLTKNLSSTFAAGIQRFRNKERFSYRDAFGFPGPGIEVLEGGASQTSSSSFTAITQIGYFFQEQLSFRDYLSLNGGLRFDSFHAGNFNSPTQIYPHVTLSFIPSSAWKWRNTTLRLHGAIGRAGQNLPPVAYFTTFVPFTSTDGAGLDPGTPANNSPKPEKVDEWELGFDAGLFNNTVGLSFAYWARTVNDAWIRRVFPASGGFPRSSLTNNGKLTSRGLEFTANWEAVKRENFAVEVFAHGAFLREKINDLGGAPAQKSGGAYPYYRNFLEEGYAPGAFFGPKLAQVDLPIDLNQDLKPETREALLAFFSQPRDPSTFFPLVVDEDGDRNLLDHYLGKPTPDWQGAFGGNIRLFKSLRLATRFEYKAGNYMSHNLTDEFRRAHPTIGRNTLETAATELILVNPASTPEQRLEAAAKWVKNFAGLSPYNGLNAIEKADFLRWRECSITYDLLRRFTGSLRLDHLAITVAGRNLALFSGYSGIDPEIDAIIDSNANYPTGTDVFGLPLARQIIFSLRAGF